MKKIKFKILTIILAFVMLFGGLFVNFNAVSAGSGDDNISVGTSEYPATAEGLNKAIVDIAEGGTITLNEDVEAENPIYIFGNEAYVRQAQFTAQKIGNKSFTIDGNGHTVKANYSVTNISGYTNPNYATAGQDDWGMQGVFAIAQFSGNVTIKNLITDADNKTTLGFWIYRTGDNGTTASKDGLVILDTVTMKNGIEKYSRGGYGAQVNASHVIAKNPTSLDNKYYGFNVDLGKGLDALSSKLEIEGISTYNETYEVFPLSGIEGYGKLANISCEKKPNISVVDNGKEYFVNDYVQETNLMGSLGDAVKTPESLPLPGEEYTEYLPQTLDTYQYDIHQAKVGWWIQKTFVLFGSRSVKVKAEPFKIIHNVKYNWNLEKTGTVGAGDIPSYVVKAIADSKDDQGYTLEGKIYTKNFKVDTSNTAKTEVKLVNDDGDIKNITPEEFVLNPSEEKVINIKFNLDNKEQATEKNPKIKVTIQSDEQIDRTIEVPISTTEEENGIDKTINVVDDKYTFDPDFTVTWEENKTVEKTYELDAITEEFKNTATITLEDGTKIEKTVILNPRPKTTKWVELDNETNILKPQVVDNEFKVKEDEFIKDNLVYEWVETVVEDNVATHYYLIKQLGLNPSTKLKVTKWVDTEGNELKETVIAKTVKEAGTIDGYTFVKTDMDSDGNVAHIFKKVNVETNVLPNTGDLSNEMAIYGGLLLISGSLLLILTKKECK